MFHYMNGEAHSESRRQQALAEAENHRLAQTCQPDGTPLTKTILAGIGDVLVGVGTRLQEQRIRPAQPVDYQPELNISRL